MDHSRCTHDHTKSARARCRREAARYNAEPSSEKWYDAHTDEDKRVYEPESASKSLPRRGERLTQRTTRTGFSVYVGSSEGYVISNYQGVLWVHIDDPPENRRLVWGEDEIELYDLDTQPEP